MGEFLSQRWERNQRIAGGDSHRRREQVPSGSSSFSPRPPENTRPNSRGLPNTVRRGRDNDCPRIHAAAAVGPKLRRAAALDQTGAPDCSSSNLCGGKSAGGSGDPPLRHFRQIIAERDNGRGKPLPYGMDGETFLGGEPADGHMGRPLRRIPPARQIIQGNTVKVRQLD